MPMECKCVEPAEMVHIGPFLPAFELRSTQALEVLLSTHTHTHTIRVRFFLFELARSQAAVTTFKRARYQTANLFTISLLV